MSVSLGAVKVPDADLAFKGLVYSGEIQLNVLVPDNAPHRRHGPSGCCHRRRVLSDRRHDKPSSNTGCKPRSAAARCSPRADFPEQPPASLRLPGETAASKTRQFRLSASFWEATRIAFDSLRKNKLRSFLTLLGIILATTTLIAVTALIHGMNLYIAEKVSNMGADGFRIVRMAWFGPWDPKKFYEMKKRNPEIKPDEYEFVKSHATLLKDIGMMASRRARVAYKGDSMEGVDIEGVTDNIPAINNVQVGSAAASRPKRCGVTRRWPSSATTFARDSSKARTRSARPSPWKAPVPGGGGGQGTG